MFLRTISPFYAPSRQSVIFPIHAFRLNAIYGECADRVVALVEPSKSILKD